MDGPMLTTEEVAWALRVDPSTVRRWIAQGKLRASRLPGRGFLRVSQAEVDRLLAAPAQATSST